MELYNVSSLEEKGTKKQIGSTDYGKMKVSLGRIQSLENNLKNLLIDIQNIKNFTSFPIEIFFSKLLTKRRINRLFGNKKIEQIDSKFSFSDDNLLLKNEITLTYKLSKLNIQTGIKNLLILNSSLEYVKDTTT